MNEKEMGEKQFDLPKSQTELIIIDAIESLPTSSKESSTTKPVEPNSHIEDEKDEKSEKEDIPDLVEEPPKIDYERYDNELQGFWYYKRMGEISTIPSERRMLFEKYNVIYRDDTQEKVLYLTFDEGYETGNTQMILDTLKEHQVPAAFFVTGRYLKRNLELVERMIDEGHIVANHSENHLDLPTLSDEDVIDEVLRVDQAFSDAYQQNMKYFRPPNGTYSERTLAILKDLGYISVFWSLFYVDWLTDQQQGADYAYDQIMPYLHEGAILLLHAVSDDNTQALDKVIRDAQKQGYVFKSLDDFGGM